MTKQMVANTYKEALPVTKVCLTERNTREQISPPYLGARYFTFLAYTWIQQTLQWWIDRKLINWEYMTYKCPFQMNSQDEIPMTDLTSLLSHPTELWIITIPYARNTPACLLGGSSKTDHVLSYSSKVDPWPGVGVWCHSSVLQMAQHHGGSSPEERVWRDQSISCTRIKPATNSCDLHGTEVWNICRHRN